MSVVGHIAAVPVMRWVLQVDGERRSPDTSKNAADSLGYALGVAASGVLPALLWALLLFGTTGAAAIWSLGWLVVVVVRQRRAATLLATAGVVVSLGFGVEPGPLGAGVVVVLVARLFAGAADGGDRTDRIADALLATCCLGVILEAPRLIDSAGGLLGRQLIDGRAGGAAFCAAMFLQSNLVTVGRRARRSRARAVKAEDEVVTVAAGERLRIARELHDVVGHRMSAIVVQAQAAQAVLGADRPAAAAVLVGMERESRAALDELRSLLGALRSSDVSPSASPTAAATLVALPQERLDNASLMAIVRGPPPGIVHMEADVSCDLGVVPSVVSLQALRIVQEAVANAGRHAPRSAVRIDITVERGALHVGIGNGRGDRGPGGGAGVGLIGMYERAALVGGAVEAGPTDDGGWLVSATLPFVAT